MRIYAALFAAALPVVAADIVLTPPSGGAVTVTNAAANANRLRVGENGLVTVSGNIELVPSTAGAGNLMKGPLTFLHDLGSHNIFVGSGAGNLFLTGASNAAIGSNALQHLTTGNYNVASGYSALFNNSTGAENAAYGAAALSANIDGNFNVASGSFSLNSNTTGDSNTAVGSQALAYNTTAGNNTAVGYGAMIANTTGANNIAIGYVAGSSLTTGSNNIMIGNQGNAAEASTIRIGQSQTKAFVVGIRGVTTGTANAIPVLIDGNGQLGTASSSRAVKDAIADMDAASAALMKLRPVTFHYKSDSSRHLEYGLIAEEVAEVMPGLVAHSGNGKIETVMYQYLPPMLLNEYQRQQRRIEAQDAKIAQLEKLVGQLIAERKKP